MVRPCKKRTVCLKLKSLYFLPQGRLGGVAKDVVIEVDELEAMRLADFESCYQEEAALKMGISRATFSNIINRAHQKVAEALILGKAIRINCPKRASAILSQTPAKAQKNQML